MPGKGEGDEGLAVGVLPQSRSVLRAHPDRTRALLGQRRVVDHEIGVTPAYERVGLGQELGFEAAASQAADETKWCRRSCVAKPSRSAMGCTLLRSPGPIRPAT